MTEKQTLMIRDDSDIALARRRVREVAALVGLSLTDQARVSLAASSLAGVVGLSNGNAGQLVIDVIDDGMHVGVRVACTNKSRLGNDLSSRVLLDVRWLVDELTLVKLPPDDDLCATLIKWCDSGEAHHA